MFYRFNAHRVKKTQDPLTATDRLAKKIAKRIISVQKHWASFMDRNARRLPYRSLKALLLVFALGSGLYCLRLINGARLTDLLGHPDTFELKRLWPFDPYGGKERLQKQQPLGYYLDSLEFESIQDSLQNPNFYQP